MTVRTVATAPIAGQKPGTSGLRKQTAVFMRAGYLETYVQAIFDSLGGVEGRSFVVGGDGRYFNDQAIQTLIKMAAAGGAARLIVGRGGLLSTPAASNLIRRRKAFGGFVLSASHNPGGPEGDFGLKYNVANGGPAPENVTDAVVAAAAAITRYRIADGPDVDLARDGETKVEGTIVEIVDPVEAYADLMQGLFDFDAIAALFSKGFRLRFDAMHAVTGPYASRILEDMLGAAPGTVENGVPSPDFGGGHPDPNRVHAKALHDLMHAPNAPGMGAASDGDGDRNLVFGKGVMVAPSDSLAVLAANAHLAPAYKDGLIGVARSMPTSQAVDRVADALGLARFETPTGWKFFGNLLDAGSVRLCGEESAGAGSDHVREKDGLWAVLLWLQITATSGKGPTDLLRDHWARFGRNYYARHDFEAIDKEAAEGLMRALRAKLDGLRGRPFAGETIARADEFSYVDPVDGSTTTGQGVRLIAESGARAIFRLSGTGTQGATLRLYLERYDGARLDATPDAALGDLAEAAYALAEIASRTGRRAPDVVT